MTTLRPTTSVRKTTPPWPWLIYVLGLVVVFFGFTDVSRVTDSSWPLFGGFLALLSLAVILAAHRGRPTA